MILLRQGMSHLCSSMSLRLLFVALLFALLHVPCHADPPYFNCSSPANFTVNSTFQNNLNSLLDSLLSNASNSSFYNTTVGKDGDQVYGNVLCIWNVSPENCQACVRSAVQDLKDTCPTSKEAITWEENCQLRYSDRRFFGDMDDTGKVPLWNKKNISDPGLFTDVVGELMGNLSGKAAFNSSTNLSATGQLNFTRIDTVYGLAQCTRDLSEDDCNRCLRSSITEILSCCNFYKGARVLSRSCYIRYELYSFNGIGAEDPPLSSNTPRLSPRGKNMVTVIIAISIALVGIVIFGICSYYFLRRKGTHKDEIEFSNRHASLHSDLGTPTGTNISYESIHGEEQMKPEDFPLIKFTDILAVTNNFSDSNKLGQGGFGVVYKGSLPDGQEVAIKRLSSDSEQGSEEFMNEIKLIIKLQHKNLVRLLSCCIEREERILVYEYMPKSSLDVFLDPRRRIDLDWRKRVNIIIGIARGLLYLHQDSRLRIIHRDLKASNVLLDNDLNPKISDFGMARIFGGNLGEASTNRIVGTYGYMAPEYAMEGLYSIKSDVFSFGVLLLEIITGKKSSGFHLSKLAPSLVAYAWKLWSEGNGLELMDRLLTEETCNTVEFLRRIQIGLLCVQQDPTVRPNMSSVVVMLGSETSVLPQPQEPAVSVGRFVIHAEQSADYSVNELTISSVVPR